MAAYFKTWLFFLRIQWPLILGCLIVIVAFWITFQFVQPPPPNHLTMAAGPKGAGYDYFAPLYAEELAKEGIQVTIVETHGSLDNVRMLNDPESPVDVAFAQAGTGWMAGVYKEDPQESSVRSLANMYEEPLWVFTRPDFSFVALRDLKGKRLALGPEGSGCKALAVDLLKWSGVTPENSTFLEGDSEEGVIALKNNRADVVFFVGGSKSVFIKNYIKDPSIQLHSFGDAEAYSRRFNFLSFAKLPQSVLDFEKNLPPTDVQVLTRPATLLTREDLHPALVYLLLKAAKKIHGDHWIFAETGQFPSTKNLEFPLQKEAARYFQNGPPLLQRYLPYNMASFLDRTKILIIPFLTLLLPLLRLAYPTYQWSIRRNIWKWYKEVNLIEKDYHSANPDTKKLLYRLLKLELRVLKVQVPFAYASELYTLRQHMVMVRRMIEKNDLGPLEP